MVYDTQTGTFDVSYNMQQHECFKFLANLL